VGRAFARDGHEVASHHWRWIDYANVDERTERDHIRRSVDAIYSATGSAPVGWYAGRASARTRRLAFEVGGFRYDSDAYNDDLPYWVDVAGIPRLIIPYAFDSNEFKFSLSPGFASAEDFESYLRRAFDFLYQEGGDRPKMMSIGLHCRVSGRPGRASALGNFLRYVSGCDDVWVCRRDEIAAHWAAQFPASPRP